MELKLPDEGFRGNVALLLNNELVAALKLFNVPLDDSRNVSGLGEAPNKIVLVSLKNYFQLRERFRRAAFNRSAGG
jgi:hypothetical protein